jgi:ubiquinone/menaquinone biosynthesis C-methylase UbiE
MCFHRMRFPAGSEHVSDPFRVLSEIARILKPGGWLYAESRNAGGWTADSYGADWQASDVAHHVSHFTPASLRARRPRRICRRP